MSFKWGREREKELLNQPLPPHKEKKPYHCGCTACEQWRGVRIIPGKLVAPAAQNPEKMSPGTVPAWPPGTWYKVGWEFRLEDHNIRLGVVLDYIDESDKSNAGHLDCVSVIWSDAIVRVTSRKWLILV